MKASAQTFTLKIILLKKEEMIASTRTQKRFNINKKIHLFVMTSEIWHSSFMEEKLNE